MTRRLIALALLTVTVGGVAMLTSSEAQSQLGVAKNYIQIQAATPGTAQSGHGNISGTMRAGQFAGGGAGLTGVPWSSITGTPATLLTLPYFSVTNLGSVSFPTFTVVNDATTGDAGAMGTQIISTSDSAAAFQAYSLGASGTNFAIRAANSSPNGFGVLSVNNASSGNAVAVFGSTSSPSGNAFLAQSTASTGTALLMETNQFGARVVSNSTGIGVGLQTTFNGTNAVGVFADGTTSNSYTGFQSSGTTAGSQNAGLIFNGEAPNGLSVGASATAIGALATGIDGYADAAANNGVGGNFETPDTNGFAIRGLSTASTGSPTGLGISLQAPEGAGVSVLHSSTIGTGRGITSLVLSGEGVAVEGQAQSSFGSGVGVIGRSASLNGIGVFGNATGTFGHGVRGTSTSTTNGAGGYFTSEGTSSTGLFGWARPVSGPTLGIRGEVDSPDGQAISGRSYAGSGLTYGVTGQAVASGFGVFAFGRSGATGTKSFVIDDPRDPENKMLMHFSHEGPEPQNVYNGSIVTDDAGRATVTLPGYFADINTDPRIQLSVVDDSDDFVMAKITQEVAGNQFRIRTSKPRTKVFWEVKAIRNDAFVQKNGFQAERDKPEHLRGKYLDPASHGLPDTRGMSYRPRQEASAPLSVRSSGRAQGAGPSPRRAQPTHVEPATRKSGAQPAIRPLGASAKRP